MSDGGSRRASSSSLWARGNKKEDKRAREEVSRGARKEKSGRLIDPQIDNKQGAEEEEEVAEGSSDDSSLTLSSMLFAASSSSALSSSSSPPTFSSEMGLAESDILRKRMLERHQQQQQQRERQFPLPSYNPSVLREESEGEVDVGGRRRGGSRGRFEAEGGVGEDVIPLEEALFRHLKEVKRDNEVDESFEEIPEDMDLSLFPLPPRYTPNEEPQLFPRETSSDPSRRPPPPSRRPPPPLFFDAPVNFDDGNNNDQNKSLDYFYEDNDADALLMRHLAEEIEYPIDASSSSSSSCHGCNIINGDCVCEFSCELGAFTFPDKQLCENALKMLTLPLIHPSLPMSVDFPHSSSSSSSYYPRHHNTDRGASESSSGALNHNNNGAVSVFSPTDDSLDPPPIHVDVINRNCDMSKCPEASLIDPECPQDSVLRVVDDQPDACCPRRRVCECDATLCLNPVCPEGHSLVVLHKVIGIPGQCCDYLDCVIQEKEEEEEGKREHCVSATGLLYRDGEYWHEDACVQCTCKRGETMCQETTCHVTCDHPTYIPGDCCPICPSTDKYPVNPGKSGNGKNNPNFNAEFKEDPSCPLKCPYGFVTNDRGKEKCACADPPTPPPTCPPLVNCKKNCPYGFRKNGKTGCEKCRCNKCPPTKCDNVCVFGYEVNNKGCIICKCKEPEIIYETKPPRYINFETTITTTTPMTPTAKPAEGTTERPLNLPEDPYDRPRFPFVTNGDPVHVPEIDQPVEGRGCVSDGFKYADGETWFDGCRRCFCDDGKEMCALIMCRVPKCPYTIIKKGDCCPSCYDNSTRETSPPALLANRTVCHTTDGIFRVEGETWQMGACTQCTCYGGMIMCETEKCPPILCERPIMEPNGCCPKCPVSGLGPPPRNAPHKKCFSESGKVYHHGEKWRSEPCLSCACHGGSVCFRHSCPPLKCNRPLLGKGQCCPTCPTASKNPTKSCEFEGSIYGHGDSWIINDCIFCNCTLGNTLCMKKMCSVQCENPVKVPGKCCPVCQPQIANGGANAGESENENEYRLSTVKPILVMPPQHRISIGVEGDKAPPSSSEQHKEVRLSDHVFVTGISTFVVVFLILLLIIFILIAYIIRGRRADEATPPPLPPKIGIPALNGGSGNGGGGGGGNLSPANNQPQNHLNSLPNSAKVVSPSRSSSIFFPNWIPGSLRPKSTNVECQGNVYIDTDKLHAAQSAAGAVVVFSPPAAAAGMEKSAAGVGGSVKQQQQQLQRHQHMDKSMDTMDKQNFSNVYIEQQKRDSEAAMLMTMSAPSTSSSSSSSSIITTSSGSVGGKPQNDYSSPSSSLPSNTATTNTSPSSSNVNSPVSSMEKIHKIDPDRERHLNNYSKPPVAPPPPPPASSPLSSSFSRGHYDHNHHQFQQQQAHQQQQRPSSPPSSSSTSSSQSSFKGPNNTIRPM